MFPNTSVIGAPSIRIRVASLSEMLASTVTPSRPSTSWSAVTLALVRLSVAVRSRPVGRSLLIMWNLFEGPKERATARILEFRDVRLALGARLLTVDKRLYAPAHHHRLGLLARHELLRKKRRARIHPLQPFRLHFLPDLQLAVMIRRHPAQKLVLLPVNRRRRHVEDQPGNIAPHLLQPGR